MIVDAYTHMFPKTYLNAISKILDPARMATWFQNKSLCHVETRIHAIQSIPNYRQVIANSMPPIEALGSPTETPHLARLANDGLADLCVKYPQSFAAFVASLPMNNIDAAVEEIDRAILVLGARGVQIFSNINGVPLDDPKFLPIFERMAYHDLPIWLHPVRSVEFSDYRTQTLSKYAGYFTFGWPYETTLAMTHLVFSGIFDKFPAIKIIAHHLGAMVPALEGRIDVGFNDFIRYSADDVVRSAMDRLALQPADYYRMFYADTATFGSEQATRLGVAYFGPEQCLFASDAPFGLADGIATSIETISVVRRLNLSCDDLEKILSRTAINLLKL